jgi:hypothetical protein
MNDSKDQAAPTPVPQVLPDVLRYLQGAPPESRQFDFLIGDWDVAATRYKEDGSVLLQYQASWQARHLNEGRMVMDDFKALTPTGQHVSSYVTLRTYSEINHRWEMAGLAALQPAIPAQWFGQWKDGEMQLTAVGNNPAGGTIRNRIRFFNITELSFSWESRISHDEEASWALSASLQATRAALP